MKRYNILSLAVMFVASSFQFSCTKDPYEDVYSNERSIEKFLVPNQVGVPVVTSRTESEATANIYLIPGASLSDLTPTIQTSYRSSVTPASGEKISFQSDSTFSFIVSAESGKTKKWNIKVKPFSYDMEGVWKVTNVQYFFKIDESWGWENTKDFQWYMEGAKNANDDTFEFKLEGVTPDGKITGSFIHNLGPDGKAPDFVYNKGSFDMNYKFDKVPAENGTWTRDLGSNTITFNETVTSLPLEWKEDGKLFLAFDPGTPDFPGGDDWDRGEIHWAKKFWFVLEKVQ